MGLIPGSGRSPGEGNGNPPQYSCLENSMDRGAWWATVRGVAKSQTWLSGWAYTHRHREWGRRKMKESGWFPGVWLEHFCGQWCHFLKKGVVSGKNGAFWGGWETSTSRCLESSWLYEPVAPGKNWARDTDMGAVSIQQRRRQWHPTLALLPAKSHGRRSLVGCSRWGREESDTTERLHFHFSLKFIGEGNGNPLQCSCLENPRDRGAWWAAIYGVAQSRTRLKWLSSSSSSIQQWFSALPANWNHLVRFKMYLHSGPTSSN